MMTSESASAILLAGGSGNRMHAVCKDKLLLKLEGYSVFLHSLSSFLHSGIFNEIIIVYRDDKQQDLLQKEINSLKREDLNSCSKIRWARGGQERQDSVQSGLSTLCAETQWIFIHDCARPLIQASDILELFEKLKIHKAATMGRPVSDTIKRCRHTENPTLLENLPRDQLIAMETPQAFDRFLLEKAYQKVKLSGLHITDETHALESISHPVYVLEARGPNPKITYPDDIPLIEYYLSISSRNTLTS